MQYLDPNELARLFRVMHSKNKNHQLIALTAFWTGARVSQVLKLQGQDIFESKGKMVIKIRAAKRGRERLHNLHFDVDPAFDMSPLIEMAKRRPLLRLFGDISRQHINRVLRQCCVLSGINPDFGHMHVFRHSIAIQIWKGTQRLGAISEFLQHASPHSALCYLAENDSRMAQETVDALRLA